jgi:hypothetical protein
MFSIGVVAVAILVFAGIGWSWHPAPEVTYVFTPCPGLTITSTATTGIWNCPNEPATSGLDTTFVSGQFVTITGTWTTGYSTLGCVPEIGQQGCIVPQIALLQDYLHADIGAGVWFVVQWKQGATVQLTDGQTVTVSGSLQEISYPSTPGVTFPIYHLNNQTAGSNLLQPQPSYEITNASVG